MKFAIYNAPAGGTLKHTETFSGVSVAQGSFSVILGSTATLPAIFSESLYVEITAEAGPAGPSYPITFSPRSALTSVPYALAPWATSSGNLFYNGGNVGIGTTAPNERLELVTPSSASIVNGLGAFNPVASTSAQGNGVAVLLGYTNSAYYSKIATIFEQSNPSFLNPALAFYTMNNSSSAGTETEKMRISSNGNVGIGTTTPYGRLSVVPANATDNPIRIMNDINEKSGIEWNYRGEGGNQTYTSIRGHLPGDGTGDLYFDANNGSGVGTRMIIKGNGNVGLGTTSPASKLQVLGDVSWGDATRTGILSYGEAGLSMGAYSGHDLQIFAGGTERIRVGSTGNLGIGTTTPLANLHISTSGANPFAGLAITSTLEGGRTFTLNQGYPGMLLFTEPNDQGQVIQNIMVLDFNHDRVGIKNLSPAYTLDVIGTIGATGMVYALGVGSISDARYKSDVMTIQDALGKVTSLRGVNFSWKTAEFPERHFTRERQIGFIAQEVEKVLPELVSLTPDGFKSVDYSKLTAVLVEAMKAQQKEINELKEMVKSLQARQKRPDNKSTGQSR
jgi:hypothetical protein